MVRYVLRRLIGSVAVFYLVATVVFAMIHAAPGDAATTLGGAFASPSQTAALRAQLGLDKPLLVQYGTYLDQLTHWDLGRSSINQQSVGELIVERLGPTLELAAAAAVFAILVGAALGTIAAARAGSWVDTVVRVGSVIGISLPQFWLGLILLIVFGVWFPDILPAGGWIPWSQSPTDNLLHLVLPAFVLGLGTLCVIARTIRASMLDVLRRDPVRYARSMGLSPRRVIGSIALPSAAIPTTTVVGLLVGFLVGGAVVVETVFSIPGIGQQLVQAFANRDVPLGLGTTLVIAAFFLLVNFLVDVAHACLDPRIRTLYRTGGAHVR